MKKLEVWNDVKGKDIFNMEKTLLKFITCGSVDDGKSTLIGHMLYDAKLLYADQIRALELDNKVKNKGEIDYSLLLDGLMAEREQGITIDVAYRYFTTDKRTFIVADTPGHEEYTRNMAVGASFADLAVILLDATQGILKQTKRHIRICKLMGIKYFVFTINKMDLVNYDECCFQKISTDIRNFVKELDLEHIKIIPVSATKGDNVTIESKNMLWYQEETLLFYLENIEINEEKIEENFILPVQRVCRPDHTFRGIQGQIESGSVSLGDELTILPSNEKSKIKSILVTDKSVEEAICGQAVTIQLEEERDISRGCVLVKNAKIKVSNMFACIILWMDDIELVAGKNYYIKLGTKMTTAIVMNIKYKIDINTGEHITADQISKNEIACCDIVLAENVAFDKFKNNKAIGSFIFINRITNMTSACGTIEHSLRRSDNIKWQNLDITREIRAKQKKQKPVTIWFTGLSGSGKSALANQIEKVLNVMEKHTMLLDGDNVRLGLNKDLGFKEKDRIENIRRIAEVSKLMNDAGLIVLVSFISPYRQDREHAKEIIGEDNFIEVYVSTPLSECEKRDVKGLYKKARAGEIPNFTGISSPYEPPIEPKIEIDTSRYNLEDATAEVLKQLKMFL